ncbi:conserved exported hypothetical protein [Candidatus Roizmanbacteria bacterium]|nr:conserved exported hypothetical protein [Candidatus Roizmanbacteria bacterium]
MNKVIITVGIIVLVLIGGVLIVTNQQSQQAEQVKMAQEKKAMEKKDNKMIKASSSRYIVYSKEAYDQASSKRRVLYFYATWCPSCKIANEDFTANPDKIPEDVIVIRTNYNDPDTDQEEKDLAKKYGITYQHTFVQIDAQGKEVTKWNGGKTDELLANIK